MLVAGLYVRLIFIITAPAPRYTRAVNLQQA